MGPSHEPGPHLLREELVALRILGRGRAGGSLAHAVASCPGWTVELLPGRGAHVPGAAGGCDVLVLAVPDGAIADVAAAVRPSPTTLVVHLAGSRSLEVLAPHPRRASLHPLVPLPDPSSGAGRLRGAWLALAGDAGVTVLAEALGGRTVTVDDDRRAAYHAAAALASNHLVALLGQVERVAATAAVPLDAYLDLAQAALDEVRARGPAAALTGPVARGDWDTVRAHLAALPADERPAYLALAAAAARLAGRTLPADLPADLTDALADHS